jgi:hypothetical protein
LPDEAEKRQSPLPPVAAFSGDRHGEEKEAGVKVAGAPPSGGGAPDPENDSISMNLDTGSRKQVKASTAKEPATPGDAACAKCCLRKGARCRAH